MKILRLMLMVLLSVFLFPVIIAIEIVFFGWCIWITRSIVKSVKICWAYLINGLRMNKDFIDNGL